MRIPIIPFDELVRLWRENDMDEKRAAGLLSDDLAYETSALDPALRGVRAVIIKLLTPKGQHIGTLIEIRHADGTIRDSHPKDYTLRDCTRVRMIQKQELTKRPRKHRSTRRSPNAQ